MTFLTMLLIRQRNHEYFPCHYFTISSEMKIIESTAWEKLKQSQV